MLRLTIRHARRSIEHPHVLGEGRVYQGRYKGFACQDDDHLWTVARYVERNPLRAKLVRRAEQWPWSSIGQQALERELRVPLSDWPIRRRKGWVRWVNSPQAPAELEAMRQCVRQGRPFGAAAWIERTARRLGLLFTLREPGRPKKKARNE